MAGTNYSLINVGTSPNSKDGDTLRAAFQKINGNFSDVYIPLEEVGLLEPKDGNYNIKGNIVSADNVVLVDINTGKITVDAVPSEVNLSVEFRVNFDNAGNVTNLENLPAGWSWSKRLNQITIVHNKDRSPKSIVYWGLTDVGEYRMRTPTAGYPASRPADGSPSFTLTLIATVTGAVNGTHALISVVF